MTKTVAQPPSRTKQGRWRMIHTEVIDFYLPLLSDAAFKVLVVLCRIADDPGTNPEQLVVIEQKALARKTGKSRASAQRGLEELMEYELVELAQQGTRHTANTYRLLQPRRLRDGHLKSGTPHTEASGRDETPAGEAPKPVEMPAGEAQVLKTTALKPETTAKDQTPARKRAVPPWKRTPSRTDLTLDPQNTFPERMQMMLWTEEQWQEHEDFIAECMAYVEERNREEEERRRHQQQTTPEEPTWFTGSSTRPN